MKRKILNVLLLITFFGYQTDGYSITSSLKKSFKKGFYVKAETKLDIIDSRGYTVISKFIKSDSLILDNFDLTNFENGDYLIELHKDLEVNVYKMVISDSGDAFLDFTTKYFKPYIYNKDHKIFVNKLNLISNLVEVSIFYENELIYEEVINEKKLERVYNLDQSKKGHYEVLILAEDKTYSSTIYL